MMLGKWASDNSDLFMFKICYHAEIKLEVLLVDSPYKGLVMQSSSVFFFGSLNKLLNKRALPVIWDTDILVIST